MGKFRSACSYKVNDENYCSFDEPSYEGSFVLIAFDEKAISTHALPLSK
jgi:hypothetical protein